MGLRINQNIAAQNAYRNLSVTDNQMSKSLEKLSSGYRINRAADDAAGLSISEGLRAQTGGLKVAVRNAQDGISVVQTAEGALNEVTSMLQRMRDLAVQTSSGGGVDSDAKAAAQKEFDQLNAELNRIGATTSFGKQKLLDGSFGTAEEITGAKTNAATVLTGTTFTIDKVNGLVPPGGAVTVTVGAPAGNTAKDFADAINAGISTALKNVAGGGYLGNEIQASAQVAPDGTGYTMKISGPQAFQLTDVTSLTAVGITAAGTASTNNPAATTGEFQVGANASANDQINISISKVDANALGTDVLDLRAVGGAKAAITALDAAITKVSGQRATLGAYQNRFEHTINNLNVTVENLSASESRIRDTDMAQEMVGYTRNQILTQAGTAMLSQANQASQNVLSLLR